MTTSGDLPEGDARLGPLAANGGATQTHALLAGSDALDNGPPDGHPLVDQRGVPRPQGTAADIGAFELMVDDGDDPPAAPDPDERPTADTEDATDATERDATEIDDDVADVDGAAPEAVAAPILPETGVTAVVLAVLGLVSVLLGVPLVRRSRHVS